MSDFFLLNEALDLNDFDCFLDGICELNAIEKKDSHRFRKHASVYDLDNYNQLVQNYGQIQGLAIKFIAQLDDCDHYIDSEATAFQFCGNNMNGFLGVDFTNTSIILEKQITDNDKYNQWLSCYQCNIDKLKAIITNYKFASGFEKEFEGLSVNVQNSIIEGFKKAVNRKLLTRPDKKIIKDVTQANFQFKIMELRVYHPVDLRVYFNELNGFVNLISIEHKSNPNQDADIKKAYEKCKKM
jgi:hypothetical protein